jgi:hypothetical protein
MRYRRNPMNSETEVEMLGTMEVRAIHSLSIDDREKLQAALDRLNQMYKIGTSEEPPLSSNPIGSNHDNT